MKVCPDNVKVVLLVGGLGTRLRSVVPGRAKPLASVGDRPFLELLLRQLSAQHFRKIVLCTGYRAQDIEGFLGDGLGWHLEIEYSKESSPLGTAGALKLAEPLLHGSPEFIVMNGDSFIELDFQRLLGSHHQFGGLATLTVTRIENQMRYGTVLIDSDRRVSGFLEKTVARSSGFVNAGVYVFNSKILEFIPHGPSSLERDIFPKILPHGVHAIEQHGIFIDIGTPEDYAHAQGLSERLYQAASRSPDSGTSGE
jgi:D-glycero-alpha-D-manno-heptose 1-phosphate guanylyltransferase